MPEQNQTPESKTVGVILLISFLMMAVSMLALIVTFVFTSIFEPKIDHEKIRLARYSETIDLLDKDQARYFLMMPEYLQSYAHNLPPEERAGYIRVWNGARTKHCPHGSYIVESEGPDNGFRRCRSESDAAFGRYLLERGLN